MGEKIERTPTEDQTTEENTEDLSFLEGDEGEKETW